MPRIKKNKKNKQGRISIEAPATTSGSFAGTVDSDKYWTKTIQGREHVECAFPDCDFSVAPIRMAYQTEVRWQHYIYGGWGETCRVVLGVEHNALPATRPTSEARAYLEADAKLLEESVATGEVRMTDPTTGAQKGSKEARYDLIPVGPLKELAELYGFGAKKYEARNWERGYDFSLSYAALQRHANLFWGGEDNDSETLKSHMASVAWHAFTLMQLLETHPEKDDRPSRDVGVLEGEVGEESVGEDWKKIGVLDSDGIVFSAEPNTPLAGVEGYRGGVRHVDIIDVGSLYPQVVEPELRARYLWAHDHTKPMTEEELKHWEEANPWTKEAKKVPTSRRSGKTNAQLRELAAWFNTPASYSYDYVILPEGAIVHTPRTRGLKNLPIPPSIFPTFTEEALRDIREQNQKAFEEEAAGENGKVERSESEPQPNQLTPSHMMEVGLSLTKMSTQQLVDMSREIEKILEQDD